MRTVKNIIFDLGGVIINLDISATIKAFQALGVSDFPTIYTQLQQHPLFDLFDKGLITETDFYTQLCSIIQIPLSYSDFKMAWNAMLLDFPAHRLQKLQALKQTHNTFLLSNTNETHVTAFEASLFLQHAYKNLEPFFNKAYYSCRMRMRKPDAEIFEYLLQQHSLKAEETLFIDDSPQHIEGARQFGIYAVQLTKGKDMCELLDELGV
jgi:glucose-1-phosphatase